MGSFHHFPTPSPSPLLPYPHLHHFCNNGVLEIRLVLKSSTLHNIYQPPVHLVLKFSCLATYFFLCHVMYCCRQCLLQEVKKGKGVANFRLFDFWSEQFVGCFYSSSKFEFGALNERTWIIECLASIDFFSIFILTLIKMKEFTRWRSGKSHQLSMWKRNCTNLNGCRRDGCWRTCGRFVLNVGSLADYRRINQRRLSSLWIIVTESYYQHSTNRYTLQGAQLVNNETCICDI